jgi:hypothetical protein
MVSDSEEYDPSDSDDGRYSCFSGDDDRRLMLTVEGERLGAESIPLGDSPTGVL